MHQAIALPLTVLSPPADLRNDATFLATHGVKILMLGNPAFGVAVKAIYECLKHLKDGGAIEALADKQASAALLRSVDRTEEFVRWQEAFLRS